MRMKEEWEVRRQEAERAAALAEEEERRYREWQQAMNVATQEYERRRQEEEHAAFVAKEQENAARAAQADWQQRRNASQEAARILEEIRASNSIHVHGCR